MCVEKFLSNDRKRLQEALGTMVMLTVLNSRIICLNLLVVGVSSGSDSLKLNWFGIPKGQEAE